jgi:uncharacterized membrane protein YqjE
MLPLVAVLQVIDDPNRFNNYMLMGYAVMFIIAIAYVLYLANMQRNVRNDLELLNRILKEGDNSAES